MADEVQSVDAAELRRQLEDRNTAIQTMKVKTKEFITKMQTGDAVNVIRHRVSPH